MERAACGPGSAVITCTHIGYHDWPFKGKDKKGWYAAIIWQFFKAHPKHHANSLLANGMLDKTTAVGAAATPPQGGDAQQGRAAIVGAGILAAAAGVAAAGVLHRRRRRGGYAEVEMTAQNDDGSAEAEAA